MSLFSRTLINTWLSTLTKNTPTNVHDSPNYYLRNPGALLTSSNPQSFNLGIGEQLLPNIFNSFETINHELLFLTCFYTSSNSQAALANALRTLSARALAFSPPHQIRVRICFSSSSLWQKLSQTSSLSGKVYPPSSWPKLLGLPGAAELKGLDMSVKSIFVKPLSVMHSKFVVVDRECLWMPSCNVSWEEWFEGCVEVRGEVVGEAVRFWESFWAGDESLPPLPVQLASPLPFEARSRPGHLLVTEAEIPPAIATQPFLADIERAIEPAAQIPLSHLCKITTLFLPSPHHRNPRFRPLPFRFFGFISFLSIPPPPPPTPLNTFLLTLFANVKNNIYIQSPNLTSPPVLSSILSALQRGVNVTVVTNRRMMIFEQLLTAGTLTEWSLSHLHREYIKYQTSSNRFHSGGRLEVGLEGRLGKLEVFYYQPKLWRRGSISTRATSRGIGVKSHLKLTVVDDEVVVLGSGNMDRASWYTSQELGIAFFSLDMAKTVLDSVRGQLEGCLESAFEEN